MNNCIKKVNIPNKGVGMIATRDIYKGEIVIVDTPVTIDSNYIYSDIFQLLHKVLNNDNLTKKFMKLCPNKLCATKLVNGGYNTIIKNISNELNKVKMINKTAYEFFVSNYTKEELLLYCLKYMCNAFDYMSKPAFLFTGTLLNHSCLPNTIFIPVNGTVLFISVRTIKKGEEITINYVNILDKKVVRNKRLLEQYGFYCKCELCSNHEVQINLVKEIIEFKNNCLQNKLYKI